MCLPIVPNWHTGCQPPSDEDPVDSYQDKRDRIPGWDPFVNRAARRRQERASARARIPVECTPLTPDEPPDNVPASRHNLPKIGPDRRRPGKRRGLVVLDDAARMMARHLLERAERCRTRWMQMHRTIVQESGDVEERLICRQNCKTRGCEECEPKRRKRQCARVAGEYGLFFTLTLPQSHQTAADAWLGATPCVAVFLRELRREIAYAKDDKPRKTARGEAARDERKALARSRFDLAGKLRYAWVLEPHVVGYPHIHMCVNLTYLSYDFVRELWSRACGVLWARINGRKVWNRDGVCRFLSKYISKGGLTLDILALLYRKRLWACTYPSKPKAESRWIPDTDKNSNIIEMECEQRETWGRDDGWKLESGQEQTYAIWRRKAPAYEAWNVRSGRELTALSLRLGVTIGCVGGPPLDLDRVREIVRGCVSSEWIRWVVDDDWLDRLRK
jgi:hypothetical protein